MVWNTAERHIYNTYVCMYSLKQDAEEYMQNFTACVPKGQKRKNVYTCNAQIPNSQYIDFI